MGAERGVSRETHFPIHKNSLFHVKHRFPIHKNRPFPQGSWMGVFHVKQFSLGRSRPASSETHPDIKPATSSISENFTARDKAQSNRSSTVSARFAITLMLGRSREDSRRKTPFR